MDSCFDRINIKFVIASDSLMGPEYYLQLAPLDFRKLNLIITTSSYGGSYTTEKSWHQAGGRP